MRPAFTEVEVAALLTTHYGFTGKIKTLPSYSDQNFLVDTADARFVLKISNSDEPFPVLDFQQQALQHLGIKAPALALPHVIPSQNGALLTEVAAPRNNTHHLVWMVSFLSGQFISDLQSHPPPLLHNLGIFMGTLDKALAGFVHPGMHRTLQWDLKHAPNLTEKLPHIKDSGKRRLVEHFLRRFDEHVVPVSGALRQSVIHNDANDNNVLVDTRNNTAIGGIIDFGDMVYTYTVCEIAIAIAYMILGKEQPLETAMPILRGYQSVYPLTEQELAVLYDMVSIRLCTSVCMSARERSLAPDNAYLAVSEQPAWHALEALQHLSVAQTTATFQTVLT
ncbi:MAG: phosphotransferase [Bacteroidota bacterium]